VVLKSILQERIHAVSLIDLSDSDYPVGLNILQAHSDIEREQLAFDLVALFNQFYDTDNSKDYTVENQGTPNVTYTYYYYAERTTLSH
jgi:hypothetical protein